MAGVRASCLIHTGCSVRQHGSAVLPPPEGPRNTQPLLRRCSCSTLLTRSAPLLPSIHCLPPWPPRSASTCSGMLPSPVSWRVARSTTQPPGAPLPPAARGWWPANSSQAAGSSEVETHTPARASLAKRDILQHAAAGWSSPDCIFALCVSRTCAAEECAGASTTLAAPGNDAQPVNEPDPLADGRLLGGSCTAVGCCCCCVCCLVK